MKFKSLKRINSKRRANTLKKPYMLYMCDDAKLVWLTDNEFKEKYQLRNEDVELDECKLIIGWQRVRDIILKRQ
jgi:hypothetical protein